MYEKRGNHHLHFPFRSASRLMWFGWVSTLFLLSTRAKKLNCWTWNKFNDDRPCGAFFLSENGSRGRDGLSTCEDQTESNRSHMLRCWASDTITRSHMQQLMVDEMFFFFRVWINDRQQLVSWARICSYYIGHNFITGWLCARACRWNLKINFQSVSKGKRKESWAGGSFDIFVGCDSVSLYHTHFLRWLIFSWLLFFIFKPDWFMNSGMIDDRVGGVECDYRSRRTSTWNPKLLLRDSLRKIIKTSNWLLLDTQLCVPWCVVWGVWSDHRHIWIFLMPWKCENVSIISQHDTESS